ncbi:SDR family oxidoreductase [Cryobacterium sp. N22]|uniref:SDR family oxidoreductase n=1 Tax=Cryobacterium sp. N22 TaxID=2048290 RepID=UPI000CE542B3|nr:SDR family oxidoreductase [Cryobacterium sp. N22]
MSKIVVIGGTGLIGSKVVAKLTAHGHEAIPASPNSGVNTLTGEGLAEVLAGADTVLDVSNSPSFADDDVMTFFTTATTNIISYAKEAGVGHYVALSVVGAELMTDSGYQRAKVAQEKLIKSSGIPYSIIHATQFFEFVKSIAATATVGDEVRLSHALIQPMAAEDVATAVARATAGKPLNGTIEVAGPEELGLDDLIRTGLAFAGDPRTVVTDPESTYFGQKLGERMLLPGTGAVIFDTRFDEWLTTAASTPAR